MNSANNSEACEVCSYLSPHTARVIDWPLECLGDHRKVVKVHKNLHTGKWTAEYDGKAYECEFIVLAQPRAVLSKAGQERARAEGVRNVHLWVEGQSISIHVHPRRILYSPLQVGKAEGWRLLHYNPFTDNEFRCHWVTPSGHVEASTWRRGDWAIFWPSGHCHVPGNQKSRQAAERGREA